jgi:hypothetical protein
LPHTEPGATEPAGKSVSAEPAAEYPALAIAAEPTTERSFADPNAARHRAEPAAALVTLTMIELYFKFLTGCRAALWLQARKM